MKKTFLSSLLIIALFNHPSISNAEDSEMKAYNLRSCLDALGEFEDGRYLFSADYTSDKMDFTVAEVNDAGGMSVYSSTGKTIIKKNGSCDSKDSSKGLAVKKVAELIRTANENLQKEEKNLKQPNLGVLSVTPGSPDDHKRKALSNLAVRKSMLPKLFEICQSIHGTDISVAAAEQLAILAKETATAPNKAAGSSN